MKLKHKHKSSASYVTTCLANLQEHCNVLIKRLNVFIKLTALLATRFARVPAADPLFIQRLRSAVWGNGWGTRWVYNQNISAVAPGFFSSSLDSTTRATVVKAHD